MPKIPVRYLDNQFFRHFLAGRSGAILTVLTGLQTTLSLGRLLPPPAGHPLSDAMS